MMKINVVRDINATKPNNTTTDATNAAFSKAYNKIRNESVAADEADDHPALNTSLAQASALLNEPAIPRCVRLTTLLLLAKMVRDYHDARMFLCEASILLSVLRTQVVRGASADTDTALEEMNETARRLKAILAGEAREAEGGGVDDNDSAYHSDG